MPPTIGKYTTVFNVPERMGSQPKCIALLGVSSSKFVATYPYKQGQTGEILPTSSMAAAVGTVWPRTMDIAFMDGEWVTPSPSASKHDVFHAGVLNRGLWKIGPDKYIVGNQALDTTYATGNIPMVTRVLFGAADLKDFVWENEPRSMGTYNDTQQLCELDIPNHFGAIAYFAGGGGGAKLGIWSASLSDPHNLIENRRQMTGSLVGGYPYRIVKVRQGKILGYGDTQPGITAADYTEPTNVFNNGPNQVFSAFCPSTQDEPGNGIAMSDGTTVLLPWFTVTPNRNIKVSVISAEGSASGVPTGGNYVTCSFTASLTSIFDQSYSATDIWLVNLNKTTNTFALVWSETNSGTPVYAKRLQFISGSAPTASFISSSNAFAIKSATDGYTLADRQLYVSRLDEDSIVVSITGAYFGFVWGVRFGEVELPVSGACKLVGADNVLGVDKIHWKV